MTNDGTIMVHEGDMVFSVAVDMRWSIGYPLAGDMKSMIFIQAAGERFNAPFGLAFSVPLYDNGFDNAQSVGDFEEFVCRQLHPSLKSLNAKRGDKKAERLFAPGTLYVDRYMNRTSRLGLILDAKRGGRVLYVHGDSIVGCTEGGVINWVLDNGKLSFYR